MKIVKINDKRISTQLYYPEPSSFSFVLLQISRLYRRSLHFYSCVVSQSNFFHIFTNGASSNFSFQSFSRCFGKYESVYVDLLTWHILCWRFKMLHSSGKYRIVHTLGVKRSFKTVWKNTNWFLAVHRSLFSFFIDRFQNCYFQLLCEIVIQKHY